MKSVTRYLLSKLTPHFANKSLGSSIQGHHWLRVPNISRSAGTYESSLPDSASQVPPPSGRRGIEPRSSDRELNPLIIRLTWYHSCNWGLFFRFFFIFQLQTANFSLAQDLYSNQQKVCMDSIFIRALKDWDVIQIKLVMGCQITQGINFLKTCHWFQCFEWCCDDLLGFPHPWFFGRQLRIIHKWEFLGDCQTSFCWLCIQAKYKQFLSTLFYQKISNIEHCHWTWILTHTLSFLRFGPFWLFCPVEIPAHVIFLTVSAFISCL